MSILAPNRKPISRYQPRARSLEPPLPPGWRPPAMWEKHAPEVALWRFVFLSILLHALLIMLFGAPTGASREGRALWGAFNVVIRESFREPQPVLRVDRTLGAPRTARRSPAASPREPQPAPRAEPPVAAPQVVQPPQPAAEPVPPVIQRLEPTPEPTFQVPKPTETIEAPRIERQMAEPPKIEAPPAPPVPPVEVPRIEAPVLPRIERQMAEPPKIEAPPMPPVQPVEIPRLEAPVMPRIERQLAEPPRIDAPKVEAPKIEAPKIEAPKIEAPKAQAPRVEAPKAESPKVEAPKAEAPKVEAPTKVEAPKADAPGARAVQTPTPRLEQGATAIETPSFRSAPAPRTGDYDPTAPALDMDAIRKRAGDITRAGTGNRAVLPFPMPPVEKPKTKMEDAIEKARKPDCNTAYKDLGLLAVVPLVANEFGEGTCRWRK